MKRTYYLFLAVLCFFLFAEAFPQNAKWKGSFKEIEGIVVVKNPKKPIYSNEIVFLKKSCP